MPPRPAVTTDLLRSAPFDRITLSRRHGPHRRARQPAPAPRARPRQDQEEPRRSGSRDRRAEIPLEGNIGLPGEPSKFKTPEQEQAEERVGRRRRPQGQDPPARGGRRPRLQGEAIEHQEDRVLRGHPARRGGPARPGARVRDGVRVLPAGQGPQPRTGPDWTTMSTTCSSPRGARRCSAGDNERGLQAAPRAAGAEARLSRDCSISSPRPTRAGSPGRSSWASSPRGGRFLHDLEQMAPEHAVVREHARPVHRPGRQAGQGGRVGRRASGGSTRSSTPCGSGRRSRRRPALRAGVRRHAHARRGRQRRARPARPLASARRPTPA